MRFSCNSLPFCRLKHLALAARTTMAADRAAIRANPRRSMPTDLAAHVPKRAAKPLVEPRGRQRGQGPTAVPRRCCATRKSTRPGPPAAAAGYYPGRSAQFKAKSCPSVCPSELPSPWSSPGAAGVVRCLWRSPRPLVAAACKGTRTPDGR